jgi:hypothetical protein
MQASFQERLDQVKEKLSQNPQQQQLEVKIN